MRSVGRRERERAAFTLIEVAIAITVALFVAAMAAPRVTSVQRRMELTQASQVVAADLDLALSLAARQRHPVRLVYSASNGEYALSDRVTGQLLRRRRLAGSSDWRVDSASFLPDTIDVSPSGLASSAVTVMLLGSGGSRRVTMTRTGIVRVTTP